MRTWSLLTCAPQNTRMKVRILHWALACLLPAMRASATLARSAMLTYLTRPAAWLLLLLLPLMVLMDGADGVDGWCCRY